MSAPCIHICPGPSVEIARQPDERDARWCFACRAHLRHEWVLLSDPEPLKDFLTWPELDGYAAIEVIASLSWYDPIWVLECSRCHRDRTSFGTSR